MVNYISNIKENTNNNKFFGDGRSRKPPSPPYTYLRNKPTNTNNATSPAKPDSPNVFMMDVRFPITLTPKTPVPNITSETAPIATKDIIR